MVKITLIIYSCIEFLNILTAQKLNYDPPPSFINNWHHHRTTVAKFAACMVPLQSFQNWRKKNVKKQIWANLREIEEIKGIEKWEGWAWMLKQPNGPWGLKLNVCLWLSQNLWSIHSIHGPFISYFDSLVEARLKGSDPHSKSLAEAKFKWKKIK